MEVNKEGSAVVDGIDRSPFSPSYRISNQTFKGLKNDIIKGIASRQANPFSKNRFITFNADTFNYFHLPVSFMFLTQK